MAWVLSVVAPAVDIELGCKVVEFAPWMEKIDAAKTLAELEQVRLSMGNFRVLDPARGSGNFLYVAYREMRRLEAEVKNRIQTRQKSKKQQVTISYVTPDHFLGIDNNPFAVEVAKVTTMMAKKLAADELDEDVDALPLDNLDELAVRPWRFGLMSPRLTMWPQWWAKPNSGGVGSMCWCTTH